MGSTRIKFGGRDNQGRQSPFAFYSWREIDLVGSLGDEIEDRPQRTRVDVLPPVTGHEIKLALIQATLEKNSGVANALYLSCCEK